MNKFGFCRQSVKVKSNFWQDNTGNGLRHASGPVRENLPPVSFIVLTRGDRVPIKKLLLEK